MIERESEVAKGPGLGGEDHRRARGSFGEREIFYVMIAAMVLNCIDLSKLTDLFTKNGEFHCM